ncbi:hypothetical protein [Yoonia sp. 208BN28-4]|uniref:hypothetical protein n=1 Tax=Yoonia sp. 208BN28-4 TaxID=3126505 RepID=UPI00309C40B8
MAAKRINWRLYLTEGERSIVFALCGIAFFGAIVAFIVVNQLGGQSQIVRPLTTYDYWIICSGALGAPAGAFLARNWFGHPGGAGVMKACVGIIVTSFLSSIIAGTLALPFYGTMFGPFSLIVTMVASPMLALIWAAMLLGAHLLVAVYRRERETIFVPKRARRRAVA